MKDKKNNVGDRNVGYRNVGDRNVGDWNACDFETGSFNTVKSDTIRIFNKDCSRETWEQCKKPSFLYFYLTEWISSDKMNETELEENPTHKATGGYFKENNYKEAFKESYKKASEEDKELLLLLPNFDTDVFFEISGIDVRKKDNNVEIETIKSDVEAILKRIEELEK